MGFGRVVWTIVRRMAVLGVLVTAFSGSALLAIYLSRGKDVSVPKVIGKSPKEAKRIVESAGLQVDAVEIFDEQSPSDVVVRQDPKAGMLVKEGYTVKIYFSSGSKRSEAPKSNNGSDFRTYKTSVRENSNGHQNCAVYIVC